jgi:plasmid stabilization system protein ParE
MALRVLREARDDLRDVARFYRAIPPPRVGRQLAARVLSEFNASLQTVVAMPLSRPEHPDIPGVRYVLFPNLPYLAFYVVAGPDVVVVAVEHGVSDYAARVLRRVGSVP